MKKYEVVITAATAHAVTAGDAGQVRTTPVFGGVTVVLDFGTPRTVSAIAAPEGVRIRSVVDLDRHRVRVAAEVLRRERA